jgi:hypothetical protein
LLSVQQKVWETPGGCQNPLGEGRVRILFFFADVSLPKVGDSALGQVALALSPPFLPIAIGRKGGTRRKRRINLLKYFYRKFME